MVERSQSIKLTEEFLNSIKILLLQSKTFGLVTFRVRGKDFKPCIVLSSLNIIATLAYISTILYCIYTTTVLDVRVIYRATDIIILTLNLVYVSTTWVCAITKRSLFIDFLVKMIDFDTKLSTMGIRINYKKCQRKIIVQNVIKCVVLSINVGALLFIAQTEDYNMIVESIDYFLIVINSIICHQIIELVLMMKTRFSILNKQINNLVDFFLGENVKTVQSKNTEQLFTLNKVCALHHHLSKLVKLFNEIFGFVLLLMFGVSFVIIVITIFYLTVFLQTSEIKVTKFVDPILTNITFIINIVYVCDVCYSTVEEVNKTGELIHKIDTENRDIRDEIEMFSLQIANEQVEFNAAGFFSINYTLIFSIIGGVTTYIIILIQLAATLAE